MMECKVGRYTFSDFETHILVETMHIFMTQSKCGWCSNRNMEKFISGIEQLDI